MEACKDLTLTTISSKDIRLGQRGTLMSECTLLHAAGKKARSASPVCDERQKLESCFQRAIILYDDNEFLPCPSGISDLRLRSRIQYRENQSLIAATFEFTESEGSVSEKSTFPASRLYRPSSISQWISSTMPGASFPLVLFLQPASQE